MFDQRQLLRRWLVTVLTSRRSSRLPSTRWPGRQVGISARSPSIQRRRAWLRRPICGLKAAELRNREIWANFVQNGLAHPGRPLLIPAARKDALPEMRLHLLGAFRLLSRVKSRLFTLSVRGGFQGFGRKSVLQPPCRIGGAEHIQIGERVTVGPNSWIQVIDAVERRTAPAISIGDGSSFAGFCTITAKSSVVIERSVLVARYVYISDHSHEFDSPNRAIMHQGIRGVAPVRICEGAWLGQGVVVCPGVTIGRNAVIGANSVVRQDIPDFAVAVGAPARVVRIGLTATPRA